MYRLGTIRTTVYFEEDIIREVKARRWKLNRAVNVTCQRLRHYLESGRIDKETRERLRSQYTTLTHPVKISVRLSQETASWIMWQQFNQSAFIRYALDKAIEDARARLFEMKWEIKMSYDRD